MSPTRRAPRGVSITEIVFVIASLSILLGLCAGLLHAVLRLDRSGRSHLVETATIGRLARQFRQDVHAASRAKPVGGEAADGPAPGLELTLPEDRTVAYEASATALVRTQRKGPAVERREAYSIPFCRDPRFLVRGSDGAVWTSLELPRSTVPGAGPGDFRHHLQVDALTSRDRRRWQLEEATP
jgi:hypothetical protein